MMTTAKIPPTIGPMPREPVAPPCSGLEENLKKLLNLFDNAGSLKNNKLNLKNKD
jgi:hypothetical protein